MPDRQPHPGGASAPRSVGTTADALARRALDALPATVARADLAALAPPLGRLLEARLDAAVDQATTASPWIDAQDARAAAAREAWREAARAAVRIPAAEREAEVRQAAHRALSHLVRPADTLAAVAFEGQAEQPLPARVALDRIRAFGPYPYLPQIAERYVERKGLGHIDRAGLERLLRRIDRRMVSTLGADDWLALLAPLMEWVGSAGQPPGTVPASLLRPLFLAKGADDLHDALDDVDAVDAETLRSLVAEALSVTSEPDAPEWSRADAASEPAPPPAGDERPLDTGGPLTDAASAVDEAPAARPEHRPPVIGSRYGTPEFEPVHESEVLGPPRPVESPPPAAREGPESEPPESEPPESEPPESEPPESEPTETTPMDAVRDAVAQEPAPRVPSPAPSVPVLDLAPPREAAPLAPRPDETAEPEPPTPAPHDPPGEPDDEPLDDEPLWMRLARAQDAAPPPVEADEDTPLWKRFAQSDLAERLPDPDEPAPASPQARPEGGPDSLDDLEARVLGPDARDKRDWFVAELFGGSAGEYRQTLAALDRAPSYTEATALISAEVLRKRSVSPYTDCAVAFIDAVQEGFERR